MDLAVHLFKCLGEERADGIEVCEVAVDGLDIASLGGDGIVRLEIGCTWALDKANRGTCLGKSDGACGSDTCKGRE